MKSLSSHAWKILAGLGLLFTGWGIHQMLNIPSFDPDHWAWLTSDLEVIEYIKFNFRSHGIWTIANGLFFTIIAATAFKNGERWAWWTLTILPIHILLLTTQFFWLFFITFPLAALTGFILLKTRDKFSQSPENRSIRSWLFFVPVIFLILFFAYDNLIVIQALNVRDPDRGWAWLTTNPEIIDYIKFYFRVFGLRVFAFGALTLLTVTLGLKKGRFSAWLSLFLLPLLSAANIILWPWTAPIWIGAILLSGIGLWLSYSSVRLAAKSD
jgi:hypothetical protein